MYILRPDPEVCPSPQAPLPWVSVPSTELHALGKPCSSPGQPMCQEDGYVHHVGGGDGLTGLCLSNCALQIHAVYRMLTGHTSMKLFKM